MKSEDYNKLLEKGQIMPLYYDLLNASGWAGVTKSGMLVDRRYYPEAIPIQENSIFGVAKPRDVPNKE